MVLPSNSAPSWHELFRLIMHMTWTERKKFLILSVNPWPESHDNRRMWARILVTYVGIILCSYNVSRVLYHSDDASRIMLIIWTVILTMTMCAKIFAMELMRGVEARNKLLTAKLMEQVQKSIDAYGTQLVDRLKQVSGRSHIDMNPISMAAANIDAMERKSTPIHNPLKAALDGIALDDEPLDPDW